MRCAALLGAFATGTAAYDTEWRQFKLDHGRAYATATEEAQRFRIFSRNLRRAEELNRAEPAGGAVYGATQFSDYTDEEYGALLGHRPRPDLIDAAPEEKVVVTGALPTSKDWTGTATTPVKDQKNCGSCWAFSAVEQMESDLILQHSVRKVLAPQELVDCEPWKDDGKCTAGSPYYAYQFIQDLGGMELESAYPYVAKKQKCNFKKSKSVVTLSGYSRVSGDGHGNGSETTMQNYVGQTGPLSICVYAEPWLSYKSGIMSSCASKMTDHCVQLVGYGVSGSTKYWKVRNSWGTSFGENGFIRIKMGGNLCNLNSDVTKTTVKVGPTPPGPAPPSPPQPTPPSPPQPTPPGPTPSGCGSCAMCMNGSKCQTGQRAPKTKAACEAKGHTWCGPSTSAK